MRCARTADIVHGCGRIVGFELWAVQGSWFNRLVDKSAQRQSREQEIIIFSIASGSSNLIFCQI